MRNDFVAAILTHGRAGRVKTVKTLRKCGYTGPVLYVIDDEDEQGDRYRDVYGAENVREFCKADYVSACDTMCPQSDTKRGVILYARNAAIDIARADGYEYVIELDDDYVTFEHRYRVGKAAKTSMLTDLDAVFDAMCDFVRATGCSTLAMAQGGDFVGGATGSSSILGSGQQWKRKAMNSFVVRTDTGFRFRGAVNEDVVTYLDAGRRGDVVLTNMAVSLVQTQTQSNAGGMTDEYADDGTYCKSMFAVVARPDCCRLSMMGTGHKRIHHKINWDRACPKIVRGR